MTRRRPPPMSWMTVGKSVLLGALVLYALYSVTLHIAHFRLLAEQTDDDFGRFYYSARNAADGGSLYGPTVATYLQLSKYTGLGRHFWNLNPPHFQVLLIPLSRLPLEQAFAVWMALNLICVGISLRWILRELPVSWTPFSAACAVCIGVSLAPTVSWTRTGQLSGLAMLASTGVWRLARRGRWRSAGAWCGVLIACKPFFAPLALLWLPRDRRPGLGALLAAGLACVVLGVSVYGAHAYLEWSVVVSEAQSWTSAIHNGSVFGPLAKAANTNGRAPYGPDITLANNIGTAMAVVVLAAGAGIAWRLRGDTDRALLVLSLTSLLASPLGWIYYAWGLAGPLLACARQRSVRIALWLTAPAWLAHYWWIIPSTPIQALTLGSAYTWALLGTLIGVVWPQRRVLASATEIPGRQTFGG